MKCKTFGVVVALSLVLAACSQDATTALSDSPDIMVGILELIENAPRPVTGQVGLTVPLSAPDTVTAGVPFDVTVTTIGLDTCWREAGATIVSELRRVTITPYDRIDRTQSGCGDAIISIPRTVRVMFGQRGDATLRVEGRRGFGLTSNNSSQLAIERTVHVR
jgi:hypothetical protein